MICGSGTVSVCAQTKHERKEKEKEEALVQLDQSGAGKKHTILDKKETC